ncbi:uncharacterized protein LOC105688374 [Athalia rosae]|uniref:uncharacterized protein LOC105688374 n=1 Tax=Athalia rosae TaxID=37344 RepID=UPI00203464AE|nr:uncharacterized protein LOC105688374 [Athalia rosae]
MSGSADISNLSYKELQALALRYRVPGNIKKQLLVEVLQAARRGNDQEVIKILTDLRQTRKKRIRKSKPAKLSLSSTPIQSPTYDMADDYHSAQHRLPYQWVAAEEEIPNRQLEDGNRVPQYEEFREFLLRRIQRDYQTYNTNNNERIGPSNPGGIIDLRNEADAVRFDSDPAELRTNLIPVNNFEVTQPYSEQLAHNVASFDYQILEDPNGNAHASILLRRMLQAPVGADLGEIASPDQLGQNCRIWETEHQSQNNLLDNSDTLSANSEVNENDVDNWPIGTEYYRFVNNVRDQLVLNPVGGNLQNDRNLNEATAGQFCNVLTDGNPIQYQLLYTNQTPDLHQGNEQQQWGTASTLDNGHQETFIDQKLKVHGSKIFPETHYYDGINATNYATPCRPVETDNPLHQHYPIEDASVYSINQNGGFDGNNCAASTPGSDVKFYQNLNDNTVRPSERENSTVTNSCAPQHHAQRQINDGNNYGFVRPPIHQSTNYCSNPVTCELLQHETESASPGVISGISNPSSSMQHFPFAAQYHQAPPPAHRYSENSVLPNSCNTPMPSWVQGTVHTQPPNIERPGNIINRQTALGHQYNSTIQKSNHPAVSQQTHNFDLTENGNRGVTAKSVGIQQEEEMNYNNTTVQSANNTPTIVPELEPFWPSQQTSGNTTNHYLENILNLNSYGYIDYSRIDQTSCIYCYAAPIVTPQRLYSAKSSCSQKRRFVAEFRQHSFSPYWLLYDDTMTGMRMSRHVKGVDYRTKKSDESTDSLKDTTAEEMLKKTTDLSESTEPDKKMLPETVPLDLEFRADEKQLTTTDATVVVEQSATPADRYRANEKVTTSDSNSELEHKSAGATLFSGTNNDQDATLQGSSLNSNLQENRNCVEQILDGNDRPTVIESFQNYSSNG